MAKIEIYAPTVRRREMDAVLSSLAEDRIGPGEQSKLLVQLARERLAFDYCLALRSPAAALSIALGALALERGSGVLLSALSPRYYQAVIEGLGLCPVLCDIAEGGCLLSPDTVRAATEEAHTRGIKSAALVLEHTLGYVPDTASFAELGIPIIEDISRSFGTVVESEDGKPGLGARGVFTILGLEERDMLTSGGGALLYARSRRDAAVLRNRFSEGVLPEYALPDMNAAMAVVQMREYPRNAEKRAGMADAYLRSALRTRHSRLASEREYNNYCFALVLETGMKDVEDYGRKKEIAVAPAFSASIAASWTEPLCKAAFSLSLRTAVFPLYPRLQPSEVDRVSRLILTLP